MEQTRIGGEKEPVYQKENLYGELSHLQDQLFSMNSEHVVKWMNDDYRDLEYKRLKLVDRLDRIHNKGTTAWREMNTALNQMDKFLVIKRRMDAILDDLRQLQ